MLSGRRLDLLDPSPLDVEIEDIAHGLARVARWNGQTLGDHAFSVAQHCVLVVDICTKLRPRLAAEWRLAALLHDAAEYVVGDMISPFKTAIGPNYKEVESRLEAAIHTRFSLPPSLPGDIKDLIKRADRVSAYYEATKLAGFEAAEARKFFGTPRGVSDLDVTPWPTKKAQARYLERFADLAFAAGLDVPRPRARSRS